MSVSTLESPPQPMLSHPEIGNTDRDFDTFYEAEYRSVVGLGYVLSGSLGVAEDLAQDAFIEAFRRWSEIGQYGKPEAWVRKVLVNKSRSRARRAVVETKALTLLGSRRVEVDGLPERSEETWAAVRALPERQAQSIALRYWNEMSISEIADALSCSTGTVKTHLKRGRASLARRLGTSEAALRKSVRLSCDHRSTLRSTSSNRDTNEHKTGTT